MATKAWTSNQLAETAGPGTSSERRNGRKPSPLVEHPANGVHNADYELEQVAKANKHLLRGWKALYESATRRKRT